MIPTILISEHCFLVLKVDRALPRVPSSRGSVRSDVTTQPHTVLDHLPSLSRGLSASLLHQFEFFVGCLAYLEEGLGSGPRLLAPSTTTLLVLPRCRSPRVFMLC